MSTINVKNIQYPAGTGTISVPSGTRIVSTTAGGISSTGMVLQVVQSSTSTIFSTTSATFVDIGLSAAITPSSSTSRILVLANVYANNQAAGGYGFQFLRNSSIIQTFYNDDGTGKWTYYSSSTSNNTVTPLAYIDSPGTTSACTYKIQAVVYAGATTVHFNRFNTSPTYGPGSYITLMEIAG